MILACPQCKTGFFVDQKQISANGRKVKCSKCKHIWLADTKEFSNERKHFLIEQGSRLLLLGKNTYALAATSGILLLLIFVTAQSLYPKTMQKAGLCPMCSHKSLSIENIQVEYNKNEKRLSLQHDLLNKSDTEQRVPPVLISIFDDKGSLIKKRAIEDANLIIPAKQSINPYITFDSIPATASTVEISIGENQFFWFKN